MNKNGLDLLSRFFVLPLSPLTSLPHLVYPRYQLTARLT
jgi:hypothetical protein